MEAATTESTWASTEFGEAELGNSLRVKRLVGMAKACAQRPAGKVTAVFSDAAEREAAYRFLESEHSNPDAMMDAAHAAGARRCKGAPFVYVPLDQSTLSFTDLAKAKGLGMAGTFSDQAEGIQVISALAVTPDGTPQGLVGQKYWTRPRVKQPTKGVLRRRPTDQKETKHWLDVMASARSRVVSHAPSTKPWFQIDRAGDAWALLVLAGLDNECWFTTRAAHDRRVYSFEPDQQYLWEEVYRHEPLGSYVIDMPAPSPRTATMQLRYVSVQLDVVDPSNSEKYPVSMSAVLASETAPPTGQKPLEWMLLTTYPVCDLESASYVVLGYAQRWRIEEFHKAWKTGACNVEDSQLRHVDHLLPWLIILASVGVRILRMTYLSRNKPETPASAEFDDDEIRVIITLAKPKKTALVGSPTIKQIVQWIAQLGGYIGTSSGGPPGVVVLARGLDRLQLAFELIRGEGET